MLSFQGAGTGLKFEGCSPPKKDVVGALPPKEPKRDHVPVAEDLFIENALGSEKVVAYHSAKATSLMEELRGAAAADVKVATSSPLSHGGESLVEALILWDYDSVPPPAKVTQREFIELHEQYLRTSYPGIHNSAIEVYCVQPLDDGLFPNAKLKCSVGPTGKNCVHQRINELIGEDASGKMCNPRTVLFVTNDPSYVLSVGQLAETRTVVVVHLEGLDSHVFSNSVSVDFILEQASRQQTQHQVALPTQQLQPENTLQPKEKSNDQAQKATSRQSAPQQQVQPVVVDTILPLPTSESTRETTRNRDGSRKMKTVPQSAHTDPQRAIIAPPPPYAKAVLAQSNEARTTSVSLSQPASIKRPPKQEKSVAVPPAKRRHKTTTNGEKSANPTSHQQRKTRQRKWGSENDVSPATTARTAATP